MAKLNQSSAKLNKSKTLPITKIGREMKRFAKTEHDDIIRIPDIVGIRPVAIQPQLAIVVAFDIPDVRIAIEVGFFNAHHIIHNITP